MTSGGGEPEVLDADDDTTDPIVDPDIGLDLEFFSDAVHVGFVVNQIFDVLDRYMPGNKIIRGVDEQFFYSLLGQAEDGNGELDSSGLSLFLSGSIAQIRRTYRIDVPDQVLIELRESFGFDLAGGRV
ncbi:MAG: hypothetical protein WCT46_05585 [Candidatus Gracilibacteria bacterium]|jgi:hypothetical protein